MATLVLALTLRATNFVAAQPDYTGEPNATAPLDDHPLDEGIRKHYQIKDFWPERRDLYWQMDQVADEAGQLHPLAFDRKVQADQNAIYGRNTWIMWCAGNDGFWNWLAQHGYGFLDFLQIIDSRKRDRRFRELGLINQPGMKKSDTPGPWGLYLDEVETPLQGPPGSSGYASGDQKSSSDGGERDPDYSQVTRETPGQGRALKSDGVNPLVYGYPTGVVGMRLFPNPDFNEEARKKWNADAFYRDEDYARNPEIVRPYRVGVSCGFCHVAVHPLNPPADPENPKWENLSSLIGNQYFRSSAIAGSRASRGNFIWHVLALAQPGTIDASLISTDHINNPNTMNGVFQIPARLARAELNPAEKQGAGAQRIPPPLEGVHGMRRVPHILLDGSDSIGAWGALARVYLNIGTFWEEWNLCHNPVIGFTKQRPFQIEVCQANSFYWQVNEKIRVKSLVDYFLWHKPDQPWQSSTAPMKLVHARDLPEKERAKLDPAQNQEIDAGRLVFTRHCMVCHSSKQPDGFAMSFAKSVKDTAWKTQAAPESGELIAPMQWDDWDDFKASPTYQAYVGRAEKLAEDPNFLADNFLSTDIRVPVSLVGTSAGRPLGRNALADWVWADFSSDTYKNLPAVSPIAYVDAFDLSRRNFSPPGRGVGYLRPATLVSIWATAPFFHNNALGKYLPDHDAARRVSTAGRLEMFQDAIEKLLWRDKRAKSPSGEGGLRDLDPGVWHGADPDWIYRTDQETYIVVPRGHLRPALERTAPRLVVWLIDYPSVLPLFLAILGALLLWSGRRWLISLAAIAMAILFIAVLLVTGLNHVLPVWVWVAVCVMLVIGIASMWGGGLVHRAEQVPVENEGERGGIKNRLSNWLITRGTTYARVTACVLVAIALFALWQSGVLVCSKVNGRLGDLTFGPIPKGVPVNSLANVDAEVSRSVQLSAIRGLLSATSKIKELPHDQNYDRESLRIFNKYAGPALMSASACPDFALDAGHYFGESLSDQDKHALIAFLKTL